MPEHGNIYEALLAVYEEVGYVQKQGRNQAQNYNYAGEKDFIEALRPAMIEAKIIIHPSGVRDTKVTEIRKGDKVAIHICSTFIYTLTHVPSQTQIIAEVAGEGSDPLDKGSYKGMTGAFKYALRQTFLIETGNDPEHDSKPENNNPKPQKNTAKAEKYVTDQLTAIKAISTEESFLTAYKATVASPFYSALLKYPDLKKKLDAAFVAKESEFKGAANA